MNLDQKPVITPFIKIVNGIELILWDRVDTPYYTERAKEYKQFLMRTEEYNVYSVVLFEPL